MEIIIKIINAYKQMGNMDFFSLYKYLTSKYWKEYVDLVMYDELNYECTKDLIDKRNKQNKFRKGLIDKYNSCIITGNGKLVCEACHIKPFILCNEKEKYDINNGLFLDACCHKLFDNFMLSINPNTFQLEIKEDLDKDQYKFIWKYNNLKLNIDEKSKKYLQFHYNLFSSYRI